MLSRALIVMQLVTSWYSTSIHAQGLNVTAIAAINGQSIFECWNIHDSPFDAAGAVNFPIGDFNGSFIGVIPPHTYIGQAFAPAVQ